MPSHQNSLATPTWCRLLLLLCAVSLSPSLLADPLLTPHSAEYKIKISIVGGQLNTELKSTADGFVATHVVKPTGMARIITRGSIRETSEFYISADGIRPSGYFAKDTLTRDKTDASIQFDWDTGEARGTVNGEDVVSIMDAVAHDHVSIQYQLMHDLMRGDPDAAYTMFEVDRLRTVNVRNIGKKEVEVPAGTFEAIGIQHQAEGSKRITTLWCVEELGYLPVIVEQHRKGKLRGRAVLSWYTPETALEAVSPAQ